MQRRGLLGRSEKRRGFTLVEMSIVLIVVGLVIMMVFPAMKAVREASARTATIQNLSTLMRAAASFTQATGCLPCPTPADTSGPGFGRVGGRENGVLCGLCNAAEGLAPFADLGLPAATAKDGWGRWITLRIDPTLATNFGVVPPTAPCLETNALCLIGMSQRGLCQKGLSTLGTPVKVRLPGGGEQPAAILFLSHGPNGYGAYAASPLSGMNGGGDHLYRGPASSCTAGSGFELCNADGDASFIDASASHVPADPFDDVLLYLSRNALIGLLGQGSCQTEW